MIVKEAALVRAYVQIVWNETQTVEWNKEEELIRVDIYFLKK